jgi:hypothetical protein
VGWAVTFHAVCVQSASLRLASGGLCLNLVNGAEERQVVGWAVTFHSVCVQSTSLSLASSGLSLNLVNGSEER